MTRPADDEAPAPSARFEARAAALLLACALGFLAAALFRPTLWHRAPAAPWARLLFDLGAFALILGCGFLCAFLAARARRRGAWTRRSFARRAKAGGGARGWPPLERARDGAGRLWVMLANIDWLGGWAPVACALLLDLLALWALWRGWRVAGPAAPPLSDQWMAGLLLAGAFPLLVLERKYAAPGPAPLPEAPMLARLCRVPLLGLLLLALAAGLRALGITLALPVEHAAAVVAALVAAEMALRAVVYLFVPLPPPGTRRSVAQSSAAGLIRLRWPSLGAIGETVSRQFGIDLARSWALAFIRRAAIPVLLGMVLFGWLLTGVTALGLTQRAIYESFGHPVAVLHPGLHVHLPWPFGVLKAVEYGVVREIPIEFPAPGAGAEAHAEAPLAAAGIEGAPPPSADRLWDASHPEEASYLVASSTNGRESFEVANIDLRVVYRIGLSDEAARQAIYNVVSPEETIRAMAGRMLARYFARYTIQDVLGQNREAFMRGFQRELQSRLTALSTGVEIMAVVVEAIHPPAGAATAYQGVQAAAIQSKVLINTAGAEAARELKMSELVGNSSRNDARAAAAERIGEARAAATLFGADRDAYRTGGASFLFERRLERLGRGLADKPLIIIDHNIPPGETPTLDLRTGRTGSGANFAPGDD